jgi:hypothetical protein
MARSPRASPSRIRWTVGHAEARLARSRDIVAAALQRLRENETVFLHAHGECDECDQARGSAAAGTR